MSVHIDISHLGRDPRRSGIQRAERELIRHWPGPAELLPCYFVAKQGALQALPREVLDVLCEDAPPGGVPAELQRLSRYLGQGQAVTPERVLNAELFIDPARAAHYCALPPQCRPYWLVYDFLPWLHPAWFSLGSAARLMPYLQALLHVRDLAFISASTRDDYVARIARRPSNGPVIPMGGDGLGLERQRFDPSRKSFGTIEPRKNALPAMQAFRSLWRDGADVHLVMIGATSPDATKELAMLEELADEPRFRHLQNLPDSGVREALRTARAMLFPSVGEGFGIPPMEALHAGIPVIISDTLPAIAAQPGHGQIRLPAVTAERIADAVRSIGSDDACARLWDDAAAMPVPGWADFARSVAAWVQA